MNFYENLFKNSIEIHRNSLKNRTFFLYVLLLNLPEENKWANYGKYFCLGILVLRCARFFYFSFWWDLVHIEVASQKCPPKTVGQFVRGVFCLKYYIIKDFLLLYCMYITFVIFKIINFL